MYFQALENGEAWSEPPSFLRVLTISRHPQSEKNSQYSMVRSEEVDRTRCVVFTATSLDSWSELNSPESKDTACILTLRTVFVFVIRFYPNWCLRADSGRAG